MSQKAFPFTGLLLVAGAMALVTPRLGQAQYGGAAPSYDDGQSALITVKVPAGARVWFNGVPMTATGPIREFHSPPLAPVKQYYYDITARWVQNGREVTQTQQAKFRAGRDVRLEFPIPPMMYGQPLSTPLR
jgi:uncharacterized protein (TIGR03000 family)